jgi:hypothetical protein
VRGEKKVQIEESREKEIRLFYPRDIFEAFDDMWSDFHRDFLTPWNLGDVGKYLEG